jgi:hypothetical protein
LAFTLLDDAGKGSLVVHGHVGQHLAVDVDPAFFMPLP